MKNSLFLLSFLLICLTNPFSTQAQLTQLSRWDDDTLPVASPNNLRLQYSSVFGHAINGNEIAIIGGARHILFFDITGTKASNPELIGKFEGTATTVWREFKSYKNRLYAVSDNTTEGLMVFDMTNAPDTIVRSYWSNEFFNSSHSITLDTVSGRIFLNGCSASSQGLTVLDVSQNPDVPTVLATIPSLEGGYIHDSYVRNDTVYASSGYSGLFVYDFKTNVTAPTTVASVTTGGYNHNSAITDDGKYLYYSEEIPKGRPVVVIDLQAINTGEINVVNSFLDAQLADPAGPLAIPHNVFISGDYLFVSQYEDGLLIYDIGTDPVNPTLISVFDTQPENTVYNGYFGNWGNYPWLPSGNILASDMQNGLFVLKNTVNPIAIKETRNPTLSVQVNPNPMSDYFNIAVETIEKWSYQLTDLTGKIVKEKRNISEKTTTFDASMLNKGIYFLNVQNSNGEMGVQKVVKL
jgi:choice-of-anchor B domain-containing protein